jgi:hypothetical protein
MTQPIFFFLFKDICRQNVNAMSFDKKIFIDVYLLLPQGHAFFSNAF